MLVFSGHIAINNILPLTLCTHSNISVMAIDKDAKLKALKLTVDRLEKQYGKGTVMKLGDQQVVEAETISTGSVSLDVALG